MRRALLLAFLLLPSIPAQGTPPLVVELAAATFEYGPEDWKGGDASSIEDQASLAAQAADWHASLGLRLEADLAVAPQRGVAGSDWEYMATLSDGASTVRGVVRAQDEGTVTVWFDVDGQRALPGLAAVPALLPGPWTLRLEAFEPEGAGHESRGWGQTALETTGVAFGGLRRGVGGDLVPGIALPEHLLPRVREVGPGPNTWINQRPLPPGQVVVEAEAEPGELLRLVVYRAVDVIPPLPDPGTGTPLEGQVQPPSPTMQWQRSEEGPLATGADGRLAVAIGVDGTGLFILALHGEQGGVAAFAVAFAEATPQVDAWEAPEPGEGGDVEVGMLAAGPRTRQATPGHAYALEQTVPGTTGGSLGGKALTQGPVFLDGDEHWRAVFDARPIRAAGVAHYTFLAFLFDETGAYRTHLGLVRGGDIDLSIPRLGVGHEAELSVRVRNLADDGQAGPAAALALPARVMLDFAGRQVGDASVAVPEGGSLKRSFLVTPEALGAQDVLAVVDAGDVRHEVHQEVTVLRGDALDDRAWYDPDRLSPGPAPLLVLAALAFALLRRRADPPRGPPPGRR